MLSTIVSLVLGYWLCMNVMWSDAFSTHAGTPFEAIPDSWVCPICGAHKASFVPYREPELKAA